jgi:hypothetical protein
VSAVDPGTPPTLVSPGRSSRALNDPISTVATSDTNPDVGSGGSAAKNGNVVAFSGGSVPPGATYAIVYITRLLAGTTGLLCTVDRLYVTDSTSWNFTFFWLNGSGVLQPAGSAEVRFVIYWY